MTIKEASEKTGVSIDNLRYYERIGLLPTIPRNKSGIRAYDDRAIHWIEFVMKFKHAGASLEAIYEYISLAQSDENTKEARRDILFEIEQDLMDKMKLLQECMDLIHYKLDNYDDLCNPVTEQMVRDSKQFEQKEQGILHDAKENLVNEGKRNV